MSEISWHHRMLGEGIAALFLKSGDQSHFIEMPWAMKCVARYFWPGGVMAASDLVGRAVAAAMRSPSMYASLMISADIHGSRFCHRTGFARRIAEYHEPLFTSSRFALVVSRPAVGGNRGCRRLAARRRRQLADRGHADIRSTWLIRRATNLLDKGPSSSALVREESMLVLFRAACMPLCAGMAVVAIAASRYQPLRRWSICLRYVHWHGGLVVMTPDAPALETCARRSVNGRVEIRRW